MDQNSVSPEVVVEKKSGSISDNGKTNEENASKPQVKQTSTHYTPKLITSLDCKILQYQYNIYKLENQSVIYGNSKLNVKDHLIYLCFIILYYW